MTDIPQTTPTPESSPSTPPPEPIVAPALPYSFKSNLTEYRKRLGVGRIALAFVLTFIFWLRFGPVVWILSVIGLTILIVGILYLLSLRRATITPEGISYRGGLGRTRTVRFDEIEGTKVFLGYYEPSFGLAPRVVVAQKNGTPIVFSGLSWVPEDLDKLLAVLKDKNVTIEYYEDVVTYAMIAKQFPTYTTYVERHPFVVATWSVIGILIVCVAIALWMTLG